MKSSLIQIVTAVSLIVSARGSDTTLSINETNTVDQAQFPQILAQPLDAAVRAGSPVIFSVLAANSPEQYQWYRNGVALDGQTNSVLKLSSVQIADTGYYTCGVIKSGELVPTRSASLNVYTLDSTGSFFMYGTPINSGGTQGGCPGAYVGYVTYMKTPSQGWGWAPSANTSVHTAYDAGGGANTIVEYEGKYGDLGCNQGSVSIPDPTFSPKYRFTIYFKSDVPTNAYPIELEGFDP